MWLQQLQVFPWVFPVWLEPPGLPCPFAILEGELYPQIPKVLPLTRPGLGVSGEGHACPLELMYLSFLFFFISSPFLFLFFIPPCFLSILSISSSLSQLT